MLFKRLANNKKPEISLNTLQKRTRDVVADKIYSGAYCLEDISCPICTSSEKVCIGEKDRYGLSYKSNICTQCGLVYTSPRMTQESFNYFYNLEYRKLYVGKETATENFFYTQTLRGKRIYNFLKDKQLISETPLSILEIGCGAGGILEVFMRKGHKVKGIDLGEEYIKYGKKYHNLNLETGTLMDLDLEETKPDIIIYSHVLEHILDLNKELEALKKIAKENTIFYIEVPGIKEVHKNYNSNILRYFQNAHTFNFSLRSLNNLFTGNGFELITGNEFIQSVFKLSTRTFSLKSDFEDIKKYLIHIESTRKRFPFTASGLKSISLLVLNKLLNVSKTKKLTQFIRNKSLFL